VAGWLRPEGQIVTLVKPQFEAGREQVGKGGVVRDPAIHADVLQRVLSWANTHGLTPMSTIRSPITGPAGNVEFLARLERGQAPRQASEIQTMVECCIPGSQQPRDPLAGRNGARA
jgi:23S rRNA (cytidine1920-2'-O)/16S rRNA (cytidine1409-2'-O)-methyltransferase